MNQFHLKIKEYDEFRSKELEFNDDNAAFIKHFTHKMNGCLFNTLAKANIEYTVSSPQMSISFLFPEEQRRCYKIISFPYYNVYAKSREFIYLSKEDFDTFDLSLLNEYIFYVEILHLYIKIVLVYLPLDKFWQIQNTIKL